MNWFPQIVASCINLPCKVIKIEAAEIMRNSPRYAALCTIDSSAPSKHFASIIDELPRRHGSLLFQLRSGHAPLNKHLFRIKKSLTATCQLCNEKDESVHHYLFECPAHIRPRNAMRTQLGTRAHHMKNLLNESKCLKTLFQYIARTRRFETTFGDMSLPKEREEVQRDGGDG